MRDAVEAPSRRWRGRGRHRAPFYPASRLRSNCGTARLYKDKVFCDLDRLLSFLSIGSDGAYYFPVQVLHELFFMIYREQLEDLRRWYLFLYCRLKLREGSSRLGRAERASPRRHGVGDVLHLSKTQ